MLKSQNTPPECASDQTWSKNMVGWWLLSITGEGGTPVYPFPVFPIGGPLEPSLYLGNGGNVHEYRQYWPIHGEPKLAISAKTLSREKYPSLASVIVPKRQANAFCDRYISAWTYRSPNLHDIEA